MYRVVRKIQEVKRGELILYRAAQGSQVEVRLEKEKIIRLTFNLIAEV